MDITNIIVKGLVHLEKEYSVEFDEIDSWEADEAYEFISDLSSNNPDDKLLEDLLPHLEDISSEDFVLSVEIFAEM